MNLERFKKVRKRFFTEEEEEDVIHNVTDIDIDWEKKLARLHVQLTLGYGDMVRTLNNITMLDTMEDTVDASFSSTKKRTTVDFANTATVRKEGQTLWIEG